MGTDFQEPVPGAESPLPTSPWQDLRVSSTGGDFGVQRGPLAAMCGLRGAWRFPRRGGFTKPAGGSGPAGSGRALTQGDPEAAAVSKAHEICPHRLITLYCLPSDLRPRTALPAPTPSRRSAGCAEGLCGRVHVLSTPDLRTWLSFLCKPLVSTDHVRAQNPTHRGRIKARTCFLLGTTRSPSLCLSPSPQPCVPTQATPTRRPGPGDGQERELVLTWKRANFSSDSKEQAQAHSTGHPLVPNPLPGPREGVGQGLPLPKAAPVGAPREEAEALGWTQALTSSAYREAVDR